MTQKKAPVRRDVITLADLAPRHDVKGGSQRRVFGANPVAETAGTDERSDTKAAKTAAKKVKDLAPKAAGGVKGGGNNLNDNITLVHTRQNTRGMR